MSTARLICTDDLEEGFVLSATRYDARRCQPHEQGVPLIRIVDLVNAQIGPKSAETVPLRILDTNSAFEGAITHWTCVPNASSLGSNKKRARAGDVIVSRLRPYLRQTAFVDREAAREDLVCSTEFFILRSRDDQSIAFLVPYLLSTSVVEFFCNSVEGGHHPRVTAATIEDLKIPAKLVKQRDRVSQQVEAAVSNIRKGMQEIDRLIHQSQGTTLT
jgi:hypothetical protein